MAHILLFLLILPIVPVTPPPAPPPGIETRSVDQECPQLRIAAPAPANRATS